MTTLETLTQFFGWLTVVCIAIYALTAAGIVFLRGFMVRVNTRLFGISEERILSISFAYVASFKLATTLFAFGPWLALKLMA